MIRMVVVDWEAKPPRITKIGDLLPAVASSNGKRHFCAVTHFRIESDYSQIAVEDASDVRYVKDDRLLRRIGGSDDGKSYWVEDQDDKERKKFASYRTAGILHLLVDDVECEIEIRPSEFWKEEFEALLADFNGTLFEILTTDKSAVEISNIRDLGDSCAELIRRLRHFCQAVRKVLASPRRTLESTTVLDRPGKIRPILATHLQLLRRPAARQVVGMAKRETFDTAENRYLLCLCQWAREIADHTYRTASLKGREIDGFRASAERQIADMDGSEVVSLDDLRNSIEREEARIEQWKLRKEEWLKGQHRAYDCSSLPRCRELTLEFPGPSGRTKKGDYVECSTDEYVVELPASMLQDRIVEPRHWYSARGVFQEFERDPPVYRAVRLESLELRQVHLLDRDREYIKKVDPDGTVRIPLVSESRRLQVEEQQVLRSRADALQSAGEEWVARSADAKNVRDEVRFLAARVRHELGVRPSPKRPSSIVYLQNPRYARVLTTYRAIQANLGVPIEKVLQAKKRGAAEISRIYERWCLVRVIRLLLRLGYRSVTPEWQSRLIDNLANNPEDRAFVELSFRNQGAARAVEVQYQGSLEGKRPDLMLTVTSLAQPFPRSVRLVLDTKFKPLKNWTGREEESPPLMTIQYELQDLLSEEKRYDRDGNIVFIVHPTKEALSSRKDGPVRLTSQLGGGAVFPSGDRPNHRHGAIFAKPGAVDGLHAAIAMALQYSMEDNEGAYNERELQNPLFCLICGSCKIEDVTPSSGTKGTWWKCQESDCGHLFIQHYCRDCGNRIWKHGSHWTYHEALLGDPYNIRCPKCGEYY